MADAPAIAAVHVASWRVGYRGLVAEDIIAARDLAERTAAWSGYLGDTPALVAERDGVVAGFASMAVPARSLDEPATGEITAFYVGPDHWRQGVGRALIDAAGAYLRDEGCDEMALWVLEGNERGRAFYAAVGLHPDGTRATDELTQRPEILLRVPL